MNLKELIEKRADLVVEMEKTLEGAKTEKRAMTEEEQSAFDTLKKDIEALDATIKAGQEAKALSDTVPEMPQDEEKKDEKPQEERAMTNERADFAAFIRGQLRGEQRADENITFGANGAVVPKTIANEVIKKVVDISPLYKDASKYNVKGTLSIPYVDEAGTTLTMAYADEFTDLEAKKETFKSVDLTGFLAGVLAKISKSLINNSDFDIVNEVTDQMAQAIAIWIDTEIVVGTVGKITGLSTATQKVTCASATAITMDEIIKLKGKLKATFQSGAYFVMHPDTLTAVRLLKDANGRYLVNDDPTKDFGVALLGKTVYTSDAMPEMAAGKSAIYYVSPKDALAVKLTEDMEIQVLKEKYATQHVVGVVAWMEADAKVKNEQAVAVLTMKA